MRDIHNSILAAASLHAAVHTASAKGEVVDLQGFNSAELIIATGAIAGDGLFAVSIEESDSDSAGFTEVKADDLIGELPDAIDEDAMHRVGYRGSKRFIRAAITKVSGTSVAASAAFILGHPAVAPTTR